LFWKKPFYAHIDFLLLLITTFLVAMGITRLMITLGPKLGLMDQPDARRVHQTPVPRAGGIAVWLTFLLAMLAAKLSGAGGSAASLQGINAFMVSSLILVTVGVIDDRGGIPACIKLGCQIAAAVVYWWLKPSGGEIFFGFAVPWFVDLAFWVAWIVLLINAFNLIDGLDGLCGGLAAISLTFMAVLQIAEGNLTDALNLGLMVACIGGFMVYNRNPARIFLGDTGSMVLGLFLATMASEVAGRKTMVGSILLPVAVAGVPLIDVLLAIWRRAVRSLVSQWSGGEQIGIFSADKDHLHHRLLARGWSQRKVTRRLHALAILFCVLALLPTLLGGMGIMLAALSTFLIALFGLRYLASVELIQSGSFIHLAIKRRPNNNLRRALYFIYDVVGLAIGCLLALMFDTNFGGRASLLPQPWVLALVFTGTGVTMLWLVKIYHRVWSHAHVREFLLVCGSLLLAAALAGTLVEVAAGDLTWRMIKVCMLTTIFAAAIVLLPRALPEILRELAVDSIHRQEHHLATKPQRVLVYGAGDLGNLYLDYLSSIPVSHFEHFQVLGFLDDKDLLQGRIIRGFEVMGSFESLPQLNHKLQLDGIIIAIHGLDEVRREQLQGTVSALGLHCYEWSCSFRSV
jgi:UDP-N-acetylmuramyl pentapeptide phosphotransferase/UDP-N-acetylglucosamine-1-phosphate transferase